VPKRLRRFYPARPDILAQKPAATNPVCIT
jgi:hypothetical protein